MRAKDKYDEAIAILTADPSLILSAWHDPATEPGGALFHYCTDDINDGCGCLTTVRSGRNRAKTKRLTVAIRADKRIPILSDGITVENLPVFAEWQRRLDKELNRV